jgi:L-asparaginase
VSQKPTILLVSLGGTITMTRGKGDGIVPTLTAADLAQTVPGLRDVAEIRTLAPFSKPGASLTIDDLEMLAQLIESELSGDVDGAVIIQGTDTIEETGFALDCLVDSEKTIVVTGAMRGAEAAGADGPANLLASSLVAADPSSATRGTLIVLNDEIHAARFVQKSHTALPSAFQSPLTGPVGLVAEGEARFLAQIRRIPRLSGDNAKDAPIALVRMSLGDDGRMLRALPSLGYRGVVIEGMGAGHMPAITTDIVSELISEIPVVLASRVNTGPVFARTYGFPGSEIDLLGRGAISAGVLSGLKARILLTLGLRRGKTREQIAAIFSNAQI